VPTRAKRIIAACANQLVFFCSRFAGENMVILRGYN
jgi:hypothetical protein